MTSSGTPVRSMAFTSRCEASHGTSSLMEPVRTFTTPPGTSEVASTSQRLTAGRGHRSLARTTEVFPDTITGARRDTRPRRAGSSGATTPTTPVGSGNVKSK